MALFTQKKYTSVKSVNREIKEMATIDQNLSNNSDQNVNNLSLLVKATNFAAIAHKNQMRKDGKTPYINHPIGVTHILTELEMSLISTYWPQLYFTIRLKTRTLLLTISKIILEKR